MSSGEDTGHQMDDITSKNGSLSSVPLTTESSQPRQTQSTQQNIYTPLSLTPHLEYSQISSVTDEAISKEATVLCNATDNGINAKSKANSSARCPAVKNQRSSVRPFFCCGSELSLVSLVDGMEIKDESPNEKKIQSIECYSSSGDEALESTPFRSRSNTMGTIDIARPSVVRRKKKDKHVVKKKFWSLRLQSKWSPGWRSRQSQRSKCSRDFSQQSITSGCSASFSGAGPSNLNRQSPAAMSVSTAASSGPFLDLFNFFPVEGIAEAAIRRRNEEMAVGIEIGTQALTRAFRSNVDMSGSMMDILRMRSRLSPANSDILRSSDSPIEDLLMNNLISQVQNPRGSIESWGGLAVPQIHTQIDYVHHLVPDLAKITSCSYYWGIMDRYEAEHLLENKPPGTFLLRDSAQEDFLFSVSFRRYNRSLHARIEQWNHRFSFDAHDPSVFSAITVCELMEHYKDPSLCMFFEPMLTRPLHRTFPFSLQHMSRTMICDRISYDDIQTLPIPNSFKKYLQTYHYKQKVRVRRFDAPDMMASADSRVM